MSESKVDHVKEAMRLLAEGNVQNILGPDPTAQVHATLALVEQVKRVADALDGVQTFDSDGEHPAIRVRTS